MRSVWFWLSATIVLCGATGWRLLPGQDGVHAAGNPGRVISVDDDGPADFNNIRAAIDAAETGDTISVAAGLYNEVVRLKEGVILQGSGAEVTTIDGRGANAVVYAASHCRIDGFTITGYAHEDIDGILCEEVNDVVISNNVVKTTTWSGVNVIRSCVVIRNNVIFGNRCAGVFASYAGSAPSVIVNNTIWDNRNEADINVWRGAAAVIVNNIVQDIDCDEESTATIQYNDVVGQAVGGGNLQVDPFFAAPNADDFHLKSQTGRWDPKGKSWAADDVTSPCIDAGDPMSTIGLEPFPNGGTVNLGAYGGTSQASKSWFSGPVCQKIIPGDINGDCRVDFADFRIMALHWLETAGSSGIIDP